MEIEDILMRNQQLILENEALRLQIEELKNGFEGSCMACEPVGEMNKKLREQNFALNDEAKELAAANEMLRLDREKCHDIMESQSHQLSQMSREFKLLRSERDEARREICMNATNEPYRQMCGSGILLPQDAAQERGWDCFKEDGK